MAADWIAEMRFDCQPSRGRPFVVVARVGRPTLSPAKGRLSAYGRCPVSLAPLIPEQSIGGQDQFQALCLALDFIRKGLKAFTAVGGRVYYHETRNPIDLDDPSFLPHATLGDLRGRRTRAKAARRRATTRRTARPRRTG
jgi:hypothetical protein